MAANQLSRSAYERLTAEFDDLTTRGRIEVAEKIERAREMGDLSENGDYHAAKDEQGHMEGRIRQLEHLLENSEIIEGGADGIVAPGTIVTLVYEGDDDDAAERYLVGHIEEQIGGLDVISPTAPLGAGARRCRGWAIGLVRGAERWGCGYVSLKVGRPGGLAAAEALSTSLRRGATWSSRVTARSTPWLGGPPSPRRSPSSTGWTATGR